MAKLARSRTPGHAVVAVCLMDGESAENTYEVPVSVGAGRIAEAARESRADALVVLPSHHLGPTALRRLAWELESTETQMLVAPGLVDSLDRAPRSPM